MHEPPQPIALWIFPISTSRFPRWLYSLMVPSRQCGNVPKRELINLTRVIVLLNAAKRMEHQALVARINRLSSTECSDISPLSESLSAEASSLEKDKVAVSSIYCSSVSMSSKANDAWKEACSSIPLVALQKHIDGDSASMDALLTADACSGILSLNGEGSFNIGQRSQHGRGIGGFRGAPDKASLINSSPSVSHATDGGIRTGGLRLFHRCLHVHVSCVQWAIEVHCFSA